jgi:hypothetical protein
MDWSKDAAAKAEIETRNLFTVLSSSIRSRKCRQPPTVAARPQHSHAVKTPHHLIGWLVCTGVVHALTRGINGIPGAIALIGR